LNFGWWGEGIYNAERYVSDSGGPNATVFVMTMPEDATYTLYGLQPKFEQIAITNSSIHEYAQKLLSTDTYGSGDYYWDLSNHSWKPDYIITNFNVEEYFNITVNPARFKEVYTSNVQGTPMVTVYEVL
jgi:hypothetical protein